MTPHRNTLLKESLAQRILILDGAMGTMIQGYKLDEAAYRGERFKDFTYALKGNNDLLTLTQPQIIGEIHRLYLEAGADIIETNTFNSTSIAMADYHLEELVYELNFASAKMVSELCDEFEKKNSAQPRYCAGVLGPTNRTASISPDVNDPGARNTNFDELVVAYTEATRGLIDGGADIILLETIFDTLNAKAALFAVESYFDAHPDKKLPIMISGTITDASGRTLSGQTTEAFWNSVRHVQPLAVGLNCALGAELIRPYIEELAQVADTYVSCHPNAGLPNPLAETGYDETPEHTASHIKEFAEAGFLNITGGCCGTTPAHIAAIAKSIKSIPPRAVPA